MEASFSPWMEVKVLRGVDKIKHILKRVDPFSGFVVGGYVRWMCSPRVIPIEPQDVDLYFEDQAAFDGCLIAFLDLGYVIRNENPVAVTLEIPKRKTKKRKKLLYLPVPQLMKPENKGAIVATSSNMKVILDNFDFTVVRIGLLDDKTALADGRFLHDEENLSLVFKNIHCPISSVLRALKYARKGYYMTVSESFKLFLDWDCRSLDYKRTLVERFKIILESGDLTKEQFEEFETLLRID